MHSENYLNHPNFGLLYRICILDNNQEIYATLYAQRMFFQVTTQQQPNKFEAVSRTDVKNLLDNRLRSYRRDGDSSSYNQLQSVYKTMF